MRVMTPSPRRSKAASLAAFLALIWLIWAAFDTYRAILAQRYLELGFDHLAILAVRGVVLHLLPHLLIGVPALFLVLRLVRGRRTLSPALLSVIAYWIYAIQFGRLEALLEPVVTGRVPRLFLMGLLLLLAVAIGAVVGHLLARAPAPDRLATRIAARCDAIATGLRTRRLARIVGHRAWWPVVLVALILSQTLPLMTRPAQIRGPSVIIVLIDTLRSDHLGCYGYTRDTSPNIDRWAQEAIVFEQAIAQASWTKPSVASIFSGLYPTVHRTGGGWHVRREVRGDSLVMVPAPPEAPGTTAKLPPGVVTLAEVFREAGYRTVSFTANRLIGRDYNYGQGFETYRFCNDPHVTSNAIAWLEEHGREPFFLYLHYMAPHAPYDPPPEFDRFTTGEDPFDLPPGDLKDAINFTRTRTLTQEDVRDLVDQYDGEILFSDDQFARLLAKLEELDLRDQTIIALTADHGEEFLEHGMVWHESVHLYEELIHVPLIIDPPGAQVAGRRAAEPVMLIDLGPTLFEMAGLPVPAEMQGRSFAPLLRGDVFVAREVYSETIDWGFKQAIRADARKLILDRDTRDMELYDLVRDPGEGDPALDLPGQEIRALLDSLDAQYARNLQQLDPDALGFEMGISEVELERLRSLGYIQ